MASKTLDPIDILLELGIDLDDLSEQDYLSALMEAIATIEFQTKGKGDDRSAVLREEVIKIRKGKRKPQAKKTKISANSLKSTPRLAAKTTKISPQKLLPGSAEVGKEEEPEQDSIIKILTDISESVKSILYSLKASNNISKNLAEDERKRQESKKRTGAESKLEKKRFEGLKKLGGKLIEPIKGPIDALFNFLKNVILGRIVIGIIDWLGDPENQKKLESLIRFFKDWWPTIVTAVLLFGTGLGGLLKSIVGITFKFIPKLLGLLPGLLKFLKSPMGRIAGLAVAGAGLAGRMMDGGKDDVDLTKGETPAQTTPAAQTPAPAQTTPAAPESKSSPASREDIVPNRGAFDELTKRQQAGRQAAPAQTETPAPAPQTGGKTPYQKLMDAGYKILSARDGLVAYEKEDGSSYQEHALSAVRVGPGKTEEERINYFFTTPNVFGNIPTLKLKGGGQVPGSGPNKDTVPAMLAPGEFVMSRGAVQKYGSSTLASMNAAGGGTNLPERVNGITYAAGGGMVSGYEKEKSSSRHKQLMNERTIPGMSGGGGGTNALTNQAKSKTFGGIVRDMFSIFRKKQIDPQTILGEVNESSGQNLAGATADRQLVKVQPGEYILPVDTVTALGGPAALDKIVAQTDSNSTPAKLGMRSERMIPNAPMRSGPVINVVPMEAPSGSKEAIDPSGSILPNFSAGTGSALKARSLGVVR